MRYKRLHLIAEQIKNNERILDIGTDHALIPIFLMEKNKNISITATDINEAPFYTAKKNLFEKGLLDNVTLIKSDGLKQINPNEFTTIIIAGMGGKTIIKILEQKSFEGRYILHATTDIPLLRQTIQQIGMKISNEWIVKEGKVYNILIEVINGDNHINDIDLFMGPYLKNNSSAIPYYKNILKTLNKNVKKSGQYNLKSKERKWLEEIIWSEKN